MRDEQDDGTRDADQIPTEEFVAVEPPPDGKGGVLVATAPPATVTSEEPEETAKRGNRIARGAKHVWSAFNIRGIKGGYGAFPLVALMAINMIELFESTAFSLAIPDIQRAFKLNLRALVTIGSYIGVLGALLSGPIGYIGDRWKRNRMVGIGGLITSVGVLATGLDRKSVV